MTVNDDAGVLLFKGRERAILVHIEEAQDMFAGFRALAILECGNRHPRRVISAQTLGQLDGRVNQIVLPDKPADEADHDEGGQGERGRRRTGLAINKRKHSKKQSKRTKVPADRVTEAEYSRKTG